MTNFIKKIQKYQKPAVWVLLFLNIALIGGYVYAVNRTVFNVVASAKAEKAIAQNSAVSAELESRYISLKNKVTLAFAYTQGFQDASGQQIFIVKKPVTSVLSLNAL
jgi:hypothetical protein